MFSWKLRTNRNRAWQMLMFKMFQMTSNWKLVTNQVTRSLQKPVYVSRSSEGYLTTGCWSPTRPAVLYIGLIDGTIEVWDLLDHSHQPSMTATVSSCQLTSMEFWKLPSIVFSTHRYFSYLQSPAHMWLF